MDPKVPNQPIIPTTAKGDKLTILFMAVFVVLSLSAVGFLWYQNQELKKMVLNYQTQVQPSPTPAATPDPTSDWKTYTNTKYDYSFRYPSDLKILGIENGLGLTDVSQESTGIDLDNSNLEISIKGDVLTKNYIAQEKQQGMSQSETVIDNTKTIIFESNLSKDYLLPHPDGEHTVIIRTRKDFDQILSTFKFLNNDQQVACTMEAKLCPDGSSVGRTGPNCEFVPCP